MRRRHPWLHTAKTFPLLLTNTRYVYRTSAGSESLIVALNIDDAPLSLAPADLELASGRVIAGSGAPPQDDITHAEVPPHGWLIIQPH
ncbi:glycosidase [Mycolicibacterium fortuitum]|uniref:Glycosidase n=1 Tax=Mycolicibacterium fortuitum TaxID=1766 RepID=A0A378UAI6_MYCFO|nr:glycosidase [Mycolicibacterium fortuitum]